MAETKKLYRSLDDRHVAGVCGGLAQYFNVDPTIVRLLFVLFTLTGGPGLILYIVLAIFVPEAETPAEKVKRKVEVDEESISVQD